MTTATIEQATRKWRPNEGPQEAFLASSAFELLYGGAAGGGKSEGLLGDAHRQVDNPNYHAILFRRKFTELDKPGALISRSMQLFSAEAEWNWNRHTWTWPSGATLTFAHLQREDDVHDYQSSAYDWVGFDELTSFTEFQYLYMFSRCRATGPGLYRSVRAATNPGNIGHGWVKARFIDKLAPYEWRYYKRVNDEDIETDESDPDALARQFIPAKVTDNPFWVTIDPDYMRRLRALPEAQHRALEYGDWDVFEGQFFGEWSRNLHVCDPFKIPTDWSRWLAVDYGFGAPWCVLWAAKAPDGRVYVYREVYESGIRAEDQPTRIVELSEGERLATRLGDPAMWQSRRETMQESIATEYATRQVALVQANNDRNEGWQRVREYLAHDNGRLPLLQVFSTCHNLIRTLPQMIYDQQNVEDLDTDGEDHAVDALRYLLMGSRTIAAVPSQPRRSGPYGTWSR